MKLSPETIKQAEKEIAKVQRILSNKNSSPSFYILSEDDPCWPDDKAIQEARGFAGEAIALHSLGTDYGGIDFHVDTYLSLNLNREMKGTRRLSVPKKLNVEGYTPFGLKIYDGVTVNSFELISFSYTLKDDPKNPFVMVGSTIDNLFDQLEAFKKLGKFKRNSSRDSIGLEHAKLGATTYNFHEPKEAARFMNNIYKLTEKKDDFWDDFRPGTLG